MGTGRNKWRFVIRNTIAPVPTHPAPPLPPHIEIPDAPELPALHRVRITGAEIWARFAAFFEHPAFQTIFGIVGGFVGVLLDGRYLALLSVLASFALERSPALRGLSTWVRGVTHILVFLVFACSLFAVGKSINKKRPNVYTPAEYAAAIKTNTPLPITQQINQFYPTTKIVESQQTHTHVIFGPPEMVTDPEQPTKPTVNLNYENQGKDVILHTSFRADLVYGKLLPTGCDKSVFETCKRTANLTTEGPMVGIGNGKMHSFSPLNTPLHEDDVLYISSTVRWKDSTGWYDTNYFEYREARNPNWHACNLGNGELQLRSPFARKKN